MKFQHSSETGIVFSDWENLLRYPRNIVMDTPTWMRIIIAAYQSSIKIGILGSVASLKPYIADRALQGRTASFTWFMHRTPIREVLAIILDHFRVIKLVINTFYMQSGRYLGKSIETVEQATSRPASQHRNHTRNLRHSLWAKWQRDLETEESDRKSVEIWWSWEVLACKKKSIGSGDQVMVISQP